MGGTIELVNLQTIAIPFGNQVGMVSINDSGDIVGNSAQSSVFPGNNAGFFLPANGGAPGHIAYPGAAFTYVNGINDQGTIIGSYFNGAHSTFGFTEKNGIYTPFSVGGGDFTEATSLNNRGDVTGYYATLGVSATGFLIRNSVLTTFSVPGFFSDLCN